MQSTPTQSVSLISISCYHPIYA